MTLKESMAMASVLIVLCLGTAWGLRTVLEWAY